MNSHVQHRNPPSRRPAEWIGPLVMTMVALNIVALAVVRALFYGSSTNFSLVVSMVVLGFFLGQLALVAIWVVLGGLNVVVRVVALLACVAWWGALSWQMINEGARIFVILMVFAVTVAVVVGIVRLIGGTVAVPSCEGLPNKSGRQFTIFGLLSLTGAVAIVSGVSRWFDASFSMIGGYLLISLPFVLISQVAFWTPLRVKKVVVTVIVIALPTLVLAYVLAELINPQQRIWAFAGAAVVLGTEAACVAVAAFVLRAAGYRALWRGRAPHSVATPSIEPSTDSETPGQ